MPDETKIERIRQALRAVKSGEAELEHIFVLAEAALSEGAESLAPPEVVAAIGATFECEADIENGGLDQLVWNKGAEHSRALARVLDAVGAIENADLIARLAFELDAVNAEYGDGGDVRLEGRDVVERFMTFRRRVGGPFFVVPDLTREVAEACIERTVACAATLPDPEGPLPAQ